MEPALTRCLFVCWPLGNKLDSVEGKAARQLQAATRYMTALLQN